MYAKVIIDITHEKLDRVFEYSIPTELEGMLKIGMEVFVPFGMGNRRIKGYIVGFSKESEYEPKKIKTIEKIVPKSVSVQSELVALAVWMKEQYGGTMIQALKTVLPIKRQEKKKEKRYVRRLVSKEEGQRKLDEFLQKNQRARARLMAALLDQDCIAYDVLKKEQKLTLEVVQSLQKQGILEILSERVYRNPVKEYQGREEKLVLTEEQKETVETFLANERLGIRPVYLLYGVTGSGKTEVYMEMIEEVIKKGKQVIVLIPEISLTYQMVMRFYKRFGDRISIINSRLSKGERFDQMERVKNGEVDIMIGPRSALFTPFDNLGLIVVDEEHESSYKSEQVPRYHARETAVFRAKMANASVVLGSATPSMEAFYRCRMGEYVLLQLKERAAKQRMAEVYTVDMREELRAGNRSILSGLLYEKMRQRLECGEQTMLFLNRRGYSGFLSCRSCGYVVKCPHCDVSLSYHNNGKMVCHYCGYTTERPKVCPSCGSKHISGFRAGTQQIEELIRREFPSARVLRMDTDTTGGKEGHEKILSAFANGQGDILIGTQMIVKGHDFPNVTLVGILAADLSLYVDDFRSGERTFQLLVQAEGRAGRGEREGEAVIQTYSPDHYAIVHAANQDYEGFYEEEMEYRMMAGYPPCENLMAVYLSAESEDLLEKAAFYLKEYAKRIKNRENVQIIGPSAPYVGKVHDIFRRILYFKHQEYGILIEVKNKLEEYIEINPGYQKVRVQFDFNPMGGF
ncbi:replication restart helicase PriA [Lachnoclostridium sp. An181]|uniref:replication restart helicase PriA n=1 Tax=Lachnoclostridium sp. An181 TaxID=1965575 RepID=UPI000B38DBCF|nr:primosomal protein N' [Lachnoclostridium sp. An181]OUP48682.1 primosomal protein N' [Lachnoclostridium sp. An181]